MPNCGSQITICDVPIRFDTYAGCSHACEYCFAQRKVDISKITTRETVAQLKKFIEGGRDAETSWCDWDIPLHWGGLSDPFQPAEREAKRSLECLKVFAKTKYPFIVSTKNALIAEEPYLSLIKQCNCVVQFSAMCSQYDNIEKGASTFMERVEAAAKLSPYVRVIIRCQPYMIEYYEDVLRNIPLYHKAGVYGCVFEGMKFFKKQPNTVKLGADQCYPSSLLKKHFTEFKRVLHEHGMKFYSGENRLRSMGDSLCCCGIDGLGWKPNTANFNHLLFDKENFKFTEKMKEKGTSYVFKTMHQSALFKKAYFNMKSFEEMMKEHAKRKQYLEALLPDGFFENLNKKQKK